MLRHYDSGKCKGKLGHTRASLLWHRAQGNLLRGFDKKTFKGQVKPEADWHAIDSPKKRTDNFFCAMTVHKYLKLEITISSFKYFRTVKQKKHQLVCLVFGRIYGAPICLRFHLTFRRKGTSICLLFVLFSVPHFL